MAKPVRVRLKSGNIRALLNRGDVQALLLEHAQAIASRAGDGHSADVQAGKARAHARVSADTQRARRKNIRENTLLKAMGGGK